MPMARWHIAVLLLTLAGPLPAASVRTLDGRTLEGVIRLDASGHLVVYGATGAPAKIEPSAVLLASFRAAAADLRQWDAVDIGQVKHFKPTTFENGILSVTAAGLDVGPSENSTADHFRFVCQPMPANGQLVARLVDFAQAPHPARVGIMIRDGLERDAANVMASVHGSHVALQYRSRAGGETVRLEQVAVPKPCWLRLARDANSVSGFVSANGTDWTPLGQVRVPLGARPYAGLAHASRQANKSSTTRFGDVMLSLAGRMATEPGPLPSTGLVLVDGTIVACEVRRADASAVRFARGGKEVSIPGTSVAQILCRQLTAAQFTSLHTPRKGLLLAAGDFVDGEMRSVEGAKIRVNSVIFGPRQFDAGRDVAAIVLRATDRTACHFEVATVDGSRLPAADVRIENDALTFEHPALGPVRVAAADLLWLRAGSARFRALPQLKIIKAAAPPSAGLRAPFVAGDAAALGIAQVHSFEQAALLLPGATVTFDLGPAEKAFTCRVAVAGPALPTARLRLSVLADDKLVSRTPSLSALDEPAAVTASLAGARRLTLRAECEDIPELACPLILLDGVLVR